MVNNTVPMIASFRFEFKVNIYGISTDIWNEDILFLI